MTKIKEYLDAASAAYLAGVPLISDEQFDRLAESAGYYEVGAKQHENVKKHWKPLYSLQKYYEDEGQAPLQEYKNKVASPKLDGACVEGLYIDGQLIQVLTRGDGTEGQDITANFLARPDLMPHNLNTLGKGYPGIMQIVGEIVSPKETVNSRNYAAGALMLKDVNEFRTRAISFYAYGVFPYIGETFTQDMHNLERLGFKTVFEPEIHNIYPCNGVVFRLDSNKEFDELGYTAKHPRGAYAKKVRAKAVETKILSVEWGVGKTGKVTPVAVLEPIMIGDKKVTRATLNNPQYIEMLGLCIGDTVGVILGGEIIPCITHKVDA